MTVVGHVAGLFRYPVKSMRAERLDGVEVSWQGLVGDRRWAFIRESQVDSGFPWLTIRERPEMALYRPRFAEPDRPEGSQTLVRTPSGDELDVADPTLANELGPGVRAIKQNRGVFDTMPLSSDNANADQSWPARRRRTHGGSIPAEHRRLGVYGSTAEPGRVTVGEPVELES